jgi:putative membrane protein
MMHWHGGGDWSGAWMFMGLFWLILLGLIGFLVLRLIPTGGTTRWQARGESPLDVLDQRFARGEVDLDTYQAQRAVLETALNRNPPRK